MSLNDPCIYVFFAFCCCLVRSPGGHWAPPAHSGLPPGSASASGALEVASSGATRRHRTLASELARVRVAAPRRATSDPAPAAGTPVRPSAAPITHEETPSVFEVNLKEHLRLWRSTRDTPDPSRRLAIKKMGVDARTFYRDVSASS